MADPRNTREILSAGEAEVLAELEGLYAATREAESKLYYIRKAMRAIGMREKQNV